MKKFAARVNALELDERGRLAARLEIGEGAAPSPGSFLVDDGLAVCAQTIYCSQEDGPDLLALAPLPGSWQPGSRLTLTGPLGRGFNPPGVLRRLALAAIDDSPGRLLWLARQAYRKGAEVALFAEAPLPALPFWLEASPLAALPEALAWADYLALDLSIEALPSLRQMLGLPVHASCPCPAQALVRLPMPCGGAAECGACAVPARRGWHLACKDGPVFDLHELDW